MPIEQATFIWPPMVNRHSNPLLGRGDPGTKKKPLVGGGKMAEGLKAWS